MKKILSFWCAIANFLMLWAQNIEVKPENPTADDSVTITFYADRGNMALKDFEGNVYIHTGVIIGTADEPSGWRYVQGDWGKHDPRMLMKKIAPNTYQFGFNIRRFYKFDKEEPFLQIGCVFRNEDGTRVAKTENEKDFFYPEMKTYPNGILEVVDGRDGQDIGNFSSIKSIPNGILVQGTRKSIQLTYYSDEVIGVSFDPNREEPAAYSAAVVAVPHTWTHTIDKSVANATIIRWGNNRYAISIKHNPMRLTYYKDGKTLATDELGFFTDKTEGIAGVRMFLDSDERVYGAGSRAINIDRRGQRLYLYNTASFGYTAGENRLNLSIPFIQTSKNYGIFFDNPRNGYFDISKTTDNILEYGVKDSALIYYMIFGDNAAKITENYTYLTGHQAIPPIWALGYIQSRFGYKTQQEAEDVVNKTLEAGFPLEATLLDLYWFGDLAQMGNMAFDTLKFPHPDSMIQKFHDKGVKTILISETYFTKTSKYYHELDSLGYFAKTDSGQTAVIPDFWAGSAALLDIFRYDAQAWFWKKYANLARTYKVDGWWCDSGEPENHPKRLRHKIGTAEEAHNLYPMYWAKMLDENHKKDFGSTRLFNLARSGYAGVQRYNIFPWSGDVSRSWASFRAQTGIMLGAGACGIGYMHSDLGGFTGGPLDEELYYRWMQMGTFSPIMRAHGSGLPSEPIYFSPKTQDLVKTAIQLRYRLLPYNYTLAWENHTKGLPLARPMYFHCTDSIAENIDDQYFWGENLMVAPIFEKGILSRNVYLPKGKWFDFHGFNKYDGGKMVSIPVFEDKIPVFIRAGAFIPTMQEVNHTSHYKADTLIMNYFPDITTPNSTYTLYTDNGQTPDSEEGGAAALLQFQGKNSAEKIEITLTPKGGYAEMPVQRNFLWGINNIVAAPLSITIGKEKLTIITGAPENDATKAYYNPQTQQLIFFMPWTYTPAPKPVKTVIKIAGKAMLK